MAFALGERTFHGCEQLCLPRYLGFQFITMYFPPDENIFVLEFLKLILKVFVALDNVFSVNFVLVFYHCKLFVCYGNRKIRCIFLEIAIAN